MNTPALLKRSLPFVALCAALLIGACTQAVKSAEPEPDPEPTPTPMIQPTLLGAWEGVHYGRDDEGVVDEKRTTTLTFTETYFFEQNHSEDADGRTRYKWDNAGTASRTDTTVTKSFVDDDRMISVVKDYFLAADGDVLLVHHWGDDEQTEGFDRFRRVVDTPMTAGQPSTLRGTWKRYGAGDGDNGWTEHLLILTFTDTRFITHNVEFNTDNGEMVDTWDGGGAWTDNGASVTKTSFEDGQEHSVDKQYVLAGDLLAINPWWADDPLEELDVFTRVQDPIPGGLIGSWRFDWTDDRDTEDENDDRFFTLTAEVEGESITLVIEFRNRSGELGYRTIEATWELDQAEWFANLTVVRATYAEGEEAPEVDDQPRWAPGTMRRIALAPSALPDHIRVSYLWDEEVWDDVQGRWVDRPDNPFGDYWMEWERQ